LASKLSLLGEAKKVERLLGRSILNLLFAVTVFFLSQAAADATVIVAQPNDPACLPTPKATPAPLPPVNNPAPLPEPAVK
jgi:hypothetical protein